jgi:cell division protein FtsA
MSFLKLFSKKPKKDCILALDIGTEFVKALIVKIDKNEGKGVILGVGKAWQNLDNMEGGAVTNIEGTVEVCQQAIFAAEREAKARCDYVILGIAGELVKGQTLTIHYTRLKPQVKISQQELEEILQKVQWQSFDKVRKELSFETGIKELDVKLINSVVIDVRIDGYKVTNPLGFCGRDVAISIFNAYAPLVHFGALQTIADDLNLDLLSIAAEPYAVARAVCEDKTEDFSAIFIDIGGGTTDLALVRSGGIEGTKMFALGGRAFTKRIANELNLNFKKAEETKINYSYGRLESNLQKKVKEILNADCKVWQSGVELALSEFPKTERLPSKILLCGGGSRLPEIKKALEDEAWHKSLLFAKPPQVRFIKPSDVFNLEDKTGKLVDQQDITPMGLANLVLELASEEDVLHSFLKKTLKTIQT